MKLTEQQEADIQAHALEAYPEEAVGVCVNGSYTRLTNKSKTPEDSFTVSPAEYEEAVGDSNNVCLIHSHPYDMHDLSEEAEYIRQLRIDRRQPSKNDMETAQAMGIEFGIVCTEGETVSPVLFFNGEPAPYEERRFASGAADCWQLVVDWYQQERGFKLPNTPREFNWWYDAPELDLYAALDDVDELVEVDIRDIEHGDIVLMSVDVDDNLINHSGVYINDDTHQASLLHHLFSMLSGYHSYYRYQKYVVKALRYTGASDE